MSTSTIDYLMGEAERLNTLGLCSYCEDDAFETGEPAYERLLCPFCGVCLAYHHDDYCHPETLGFDPGP